VTSFHAASLAAQKSGVKPARLSKTQRFPDRRQQLIRDNAVPVIGRMHPVFGQPIMFVKPKQVRAFDQINKGGETYRHHFGTHLVFIPHEGQVVRYTVQAEDGGYELHGGGDAGLVNALYDEMTRPPGEPLHAGPDSTVHSHLIAFAAEEARVAGKVVDLEEFCRREGGPKLNTQ